MRRNCIRLNPIEHDTLARLYVEKRIATDRYMHRPDELRELAEAFNGLTGREDPAEDILHYIQTKRRRAGKFPKLNGSHIRLPVVLGRLVDEEHKEDLKRLYTELGHGPERFVHHHDLAVLLERRFFEETGTRQRAYVLATAMMELRKQGELPKLDEKNRGFDDFDQAEEAAG